MYVTFSSFGKKQAWHRSLISVFECVEASEILYVLCPQKGNFTSKYFCQAHHERIRVHRTAWCYAIPMPSQKGTPDALPEGQMTLVLGSVLSILPFILVIFGQTLRFPFMQLMLRPGCQSIASSLAPTQMFPPATQLYLATCFFPPITKPKNLRGFVFCFFFSCLLVSTCYLITQLKQTSSRLSSAQFQ